MVADLACDYHTASNNSPWLLKTPKIRQSSYSEHVQELMEDGARKIEDGQGMVPFDKLEQVVDITLVEALAKRRSVREFSSTAISCAKLGKLLGLSNGFKNLTGTGSSSTRNAPSAGGLASCEMYVLSLNVENVEPGIFHYDASSHRLNLMKKGDFREWASRMVILQAELGEAGALIFLASNQGRLRSKYGPRAYRLGLLDAGHVSENLYLVAAALNLGITATGGFIDDELNFALGLDGVDDCVVLTLAVGEYQ
jgi:SagB-type dehydrogenase family enzyme